MDEDFEGVTIGKVGECPLVAGGNIVRRIEGVDGLHAAGVQEIVEFLDELQVLVLFVAEAIRRNIRVIVPFVHPSPVVEDNVIVVVVGAVTEAGVIAGGDLIGVVSAQLVDALSGGPPPQGPIIVDVLDHGIFVGDLEFRGEETVAGDETTWLVIGQEPVKDRRGAQGGLAQL